MFSKKNNNGDLKHCCVSRGCLPEKLEKEQLWELDTDGISGTRDANSSSLGDQENSGASTETSQPAGRAGGQGNDEFQF